MAIDDLKTRATEGEMIGRLIRGHKAGEFAEMTVLRGSERVTLKMPMQ